MKRDDLKKEMNNILSNKKIKDAVVVVLILAFLLIVVSFFTDTKKSEAKQTDSQVIVKSDEEKAMEMQNQKYEEKQKNELKSILKKMAGVGEVEVMMYFKSGEVKVPAVDDTNQVAETKENDSNGGTRTNTQKTDGSKVVMKTEDGNNEPVILQTNNPTITGIIVMAEGAESSKIKYNIQMAISSLYDLSLDKVNVYPMES